jgi:3-oxoacyl-[acyl-carrier-protein] synthase-3
MALATTSQTRIAGIHTCVPSRRFNNLTDPVEFSREEVLKVTGMAGIRERRIAGDGVCSSDLCAAAARSLLSRLDWPADSVDALIMVTQSPDYFLPSSSCIVQQRLGLSDRCATFDVGLGCSGYPYGLWLGAMMIQTGLRRVLLVHGETPTRFVDPADRSVSLLFGDAGSATALERRENAAPWHYALHSDGSGAGAMIIEAGGFRNRFSPDPRKYCVAMDGAAVFNFTIKRVGPLITDTLAAAGIDPSGVDYFIFHQSNLYIIRHIMAKAGLPSAKVPVILQEYGNPGGPSVPLTITCGNLHRPADRPLRLLLLGYGVGLSWGSALVELPPDAVLDSADFDDAAAAA